MRQAIVTKWLGPTNHRGSRVKATCVAGSHTMGWHYGLSREANHAAAARELALMLGWPGHWIGGSMPSEDGNCYVAVDHQRDGQDAFTVFEENRP